MSTSFHFNIGLKDVRKSFLSFLHPYKALKNNKGNSCEAVNSFLVEQSEDLICSMWFIAHEVLD